ncbi:MAG: UPF0175 family protein [Nitrospirota bacterium]
MGRVAELRISVDESILVSLKEGKQRFAKEMLFNNAVALYRKKKLSLGKASELAGLDRIDFIKKLKDEGEYIFDYDDEMINEVIKDSGKALKLLKAEQKHK